MRSLICTSVAVVALLASLFGAVEKDYAPARIVRAAVLADDGDSKRSACASRTPDESLVAGRRMEDRRWKIEISGWGFGLKIVGTWPGP